MEKTVLIEIAESGRQALKLAAVLSDKNMKDLATELAKNELKRLQNKE
jgi:hypothetical protein